MILRSSSNTAAAAASSQELEGSGDSCDSSGSSGSLIPARIFNKDKMTEDEKLKVASWLDRMKETDKFNRPEPRKSTILLDKRDGTVPINAFPKKIAMIKPYEYMKVEGRDRALPRRSKRLQRRSSNTRQ